MKGILTAALLLASSIAEAEPPASTRPQSVRLTLPALPLPPTAAPVPWNTARFADALTFARVPVLGRVG